MIFAELDYISKVDFTKGFSTWHIQWPVKNVMKEEQHSADFDTVIQNENGTRSLFKWRLAIESRTDVLCGGACKWFGLLQRESSTTAVVFFRLALCGKGKDPLFSDTHAFIATPDLRSRNSDRGNTYPEDGVRSYVCNDMVFHCWIDIPNASPKLLNNRKRNLDGEAVNAFFRLRAWESLSTDFSDLFQGVLDKDPEMKALSDVTLTALDGYGERRSFYCHRSVLSARSSVFRRMFANENWKEAANKTDGVVEIDDVEAETLEYLLKYIYTGALLDADDDESPLPFAECSDFLNVVRAADKYDLPKLLEFCSAVLISFNFEDECDRIGQLLHADRQRLHQLKAVCIAALSTNLSFFENADSVKAFPEGLLFELLQASTKRQLETKQMTVETATK